MFKKWVLSTVVVLLMLTRPVSAGVALFVYDVGWPDVVVLPEGPAIIYAHGTTATLRTPVRLVWETTLPEPGLYLSAAYCRGEVRAVVQGNTTDQALEIRQGAVRAFGPSFGQNATRLACVANRFLAYTQFSPTQYAVSDLDTMTTEIRTMPQTSQGFRDVLPDGSVRLADEWFQFPNQYGHGRSIHQPVERCGIYVGQDSNVDRILALMPDRVFTVVGFMGFEPGIECFDGGFATAARTPRGAALAIVTPPYPPHEPIDPPRVEICGNGIDDDGDTLIDETPPCPPVVQDPASLLADITRERERITGKPTNAQLGALLNRVAWANRAAGWGLSRKNGGNLCPSLVGNIACDILHHRPTDTLYDVFSDVDGSASPTWGKADHHHDPNRPWVAPVEPTTDPDPDPDPVLAKRVAALEGDVLRLRTELQQTQAKVNGLEATLLDVGARTSTLEQKVVVLEQKPGGGLTLQQKAALDAVCEFLDRLRDGVGTSRTLGHTHALRLGFGCPAR